MSLQYAIQPDRQLVILTGDGRPDLFELRTQLDAIAADRCFQSGYAFLFDVRGRTEAPSQEYIEHGLWLIGESVPRIGRGPWAVLTNDTAVYRMARMAETLAPGHQLSVRGFQAEEYQQAMAWLTDAPAGGPVEGGATR